MNKVKDTAPIDLEQDDFMQKIDRSQLAKEIEDINNKHQEQKYQNEKIEVKSKEVVEPRALFMASKPVVATNMDSDQFKKIQYQGKRKIILVAQDNEATDSISKSESVFESDASLPGNYAKRFQK